MKKRRICTVSHTRCPVIGSPNYAVLEHLPMITDTKTYVSELEGNLKVAGEVRRELGVHLKDLKKVISVNLVQVAVGQCSNVAARLADRLMFTDVLPEHVVFAYITL